MFKVFLVALAAVLSCPSAVLAKARMAHCILAVDGKTYIDQPCIYDSGNGGDFSIGAAANGHKALPFFAYVSGNGDGTARGFWNGNAGVSRAQDSLGTLRRDGACWSNARARVCAK